MDAPLKRTLQNVLNSVALACLTTAAACAHAQSTSDIDLAAWTTDTTTGIAYRAQLIGTRRYLIELRLPSGRSVVADVDEVDEVIPAVTLRAVNGPLTSGRGLSSDEIAALNSLGRRWKYSGSKENAHTISLLSLLSTVPPGESFDVDQRADPHLR